MSIVYKYRPINQYTYDLLLNNEFYLNFPSKFNDPFDGKVDSKYDGNPEDYEKLFERLNVPEYKRVHLRDYLKHIGYDSSLIPKGPKIFRREILIMFSLSKINDNLLMWAHYSDSHKGICLGFETASYGKSIGLLFDEKMHNYTGLDAPDNYYPLYEVNYSDNKPAPYNGLKDAPVKAFEFAKTKNMCWSYEQELRLIALYDDFKKQNFKFKKEILKSITFGLNTTEDEKNKIKSLVDERYIQNGLPVKFYKADMVEGKYELNIIEA